jgi:predicted esterase
MFHGDEDPMVRLEWAEGSRQYLEDMGCKSVGWSVYNGLGHSASDAELDDVERFVSERLPPISKL